MQYQPHPSTTLPRIAIVGSGISGLSAAWHLKNHAHVTVFEADSRAGGHAHTVDIRVGGKVFGVDTGFLVFNHRTYPELTPFFKLLGVATSPSDMGFSVQVKDAALEWAGNSLNSVFSQRKNLLKPAFWSMLIDLVRFNRAATQYALNPPNALQTLGDYLRDHGYSNAFRDWYLVPMAAAIWSCPTATMLAYPMATFARFCHNHGLLQITQRPQWHTVTGGSRNYVQAVLAQLPDVRLNSPVTALERSSTGVTLHTPQTQERFDAVVLSNHSDQILELLGDSASPQEQALLGAISYQANTAVLHTDASVLPSHPRTWAAWNYQAEQTQLNVQTVCLHYLLNKLQPLPVSQDYPVIVSLNPLPGKLPNPKQVLRSFEYAHPVFNSAAIAAQAQLPSIQGQQRSWFAGAWTQYGFHEDGFVSGKAAAAGVIDALSLQLLNLNPHP